MRSTAFFFCSSKLLSLAALFLALGCAQLGLDFGQSSQSVGGGSGDPIDHGEGIHAPGWGSVNTGPLPDFCTKIEGGEIGQDGLQLDVAGIALQITAWRSKDGEAGEYIGFEYSASAEVWLSVKCGNDIFQENGDGSWVNPNGSSGPTAHAISNVVFCPPAGDDGSPQPGDVPGGSTPGGGDDEPYCSEVHPELCPGGVYPGDGSASPGEVPGGSVPGDGDEGSDDGDDDDSASPGEVPGGSVPGDGDDGSDGELFCSEEHPELCPGGVYPGDGSSGSDDGGAGSLPPGGGTGLDGDDGTSSGDDGTSSGDDGTSSGDDGTSSGDDGTSGGSSGGSGTTTQCTEANLADCL